LDESGARTNMTRLYGWAPRGQRCVDRTPHGHWKTLTMLSAMRLDGVIRDATVVIDGAINAPTFVNYVEQCLAPALRPGDVVVMDNLSAHKAAGVAEAIEAAGAGVWYLPAYSPDMNPIEKLWSKVKAWLRRAGARDLVSLVSQIAQALLDVDATQCGNYMAS
ncbi:MAG: IS630 family transposase, partial [Planctomycetes bacterium]|nr:IS630 family transposase [Planctomycetota bacterium]